MTDQAISELQDLGPRSRAMLAGAGINMVSQLRGLGSERATHLTLAHPRNPKAPGNNATNVRELPASISVTFTEVSLIQQQAGATWQLLRRFPVPRFRPGLA